MLQVNATKDAKVADTKNIGLNVLQKLNDAER